LKYKQSGGPVLTFRFPGGGNNLYPCPWVFAKTKPQEIIITVLH